MPLAIVGVKCYSNWMITVEENAVVDARHRLTLTVPESVTPGSHRGILMIADEQKASVGAEDPAEEAIGAFARDGTPAGRLAEEILHGRGDSA